MPNWLARRTLLRPWMGRQSTGVIQDRQLHYPELAAVEAANVPLLPYAGLASVWDGYAARRTPDYPGCLRVLARSGQIRPAALRPLSKWPESALDLACGTGSLTVRLAEFVPHVVGIDVSEAMLDYARRRLLPHRHVEFRQGDFRDLQVDRPFDVVICPGNSLNYVRPGELERVFQGVAKALRPGGLFLFDTITRAGMHALNGLYVHCDLGHIRFALKCDYDLERRRETVRALLPAGVETHHRIPIDPEDVDEAALAAGLEGLDRFSHWFWPRTWHPQSCFFFLRRRG